MSMLFLCLLWSCFVPSQSVAISLPSLLFLGGVRMYFPCDYFQTFDHLFLFGRQNWWIDKWVSAVRREQRHVLFRFSTWHLLSINFSLLRRLRLAQAVFQCKNRAQIYWIIANYRQFCTNLRRFQHIVTEVVSTFLIKSIILKFGSSNGASAEIGIFGKFRTWGLDRFRRNTRSTTKITHQAQMIHTIIGISNGILS